jgi:hypothetical protein
VLTQPSGPPCAQAHESPLSGPLVPGPTARRCLSRPCPGPACRGGTRTRDDPLAFQSSVSTDHSQNFILRCCARLSVLELYAPPGGRNAQGTVPTSALCSAMAWVHLRGLRGGRQGGHVRVVPGVVAEQVARARFAAGQPRSGRCVLPKVKERGRHAPRAQHRQDRHCAGAGAVVEGQGHGLARAGRVIVRPVGCCRAARRDLGRADLRRGGDPVRRAAARGPRRPLVRGRRG